MFTAESGRGDRGHTPLHCGGSHICKLRPQMGQYRPDDCGIGSENTIWVVLDNDKPHNWFSLE